MAKFQLSRLEAGFIAAAARGGDVKVKRDMQEEQSRKGVGVGDGKSGTMENRGDDVDLFYLTFNT